MTFDVATVKIDVVKKRRDAVVKKDLLFPKMEAFSLTVSHNEPLFDTQKDAVLLLAEEKTEQSGIFGPVRILRRNQD